MRAAGVIALCLLVAVAVAVLAVDRSWQPPLAVTLDAGVPRAVVGAPAETTTPAPSPAAAEDVERLSRLTLAELLRLPDDTMMFEVTRRLLVRRARQGFDQLTPLEQLVLRSEALGIRLTRGGFLAWWESPWSDDYPQTMRALDLTGARDLRPLLLKSLAAFEHGEPPADEKERAARLDALVEDGISPFLELDEKARELLPKHAAAMARFVRANWEAIDAPPMPLREEKPKEAP